MSLGSEFQAIVSVIAVNNQFSFPRGVLRFPSLPGISDTQSCSIPAIGSGFCMFDNKTGEDEVVARRHAEDMTQGGGGHYSTTLLA